jgi:deazaflavin-dependent oxidoreductase (nitroreductase family)
VTNSDRMIGAGAWMLENGHRALLKLSGGRFPKTVAGMQPIELHTVGRKTGLRRSTLLTSAIYSPDRVVLVASKGGYSDDPIWYKNLVANPNVEITVGDRTTAMTARTASPDEKAVLWPELVKVYKGYDGYQRNTTRDIPVVICEPSPAA